LAQLSIKFRDGTTRNVELRGVLSMGRQSTNEIQLPEELASRQHARVIPSGRSFIIEDLRSANGTFVNGQRIQRRVLANGDLIRIGGCELTFKDEASKDLVGELIADRYRVLGKLGTGGMGTVYKALQISMDRQVALKVLNPELTRDREFVVGFLNEARTAGQLNHPNIIQVHDFGEWEGFYYFSMEMVEGETVLTIVKRDGKIPPQLALTMMGQLCDGLNHAHQHNIVHQDIKPQNMLIDRRNKDIIKLADLGLAKVMGQEKGQRRGLLMGTPHYMAPEQARGGAVDGRTDIYATGATLFHMLTGRVPYDGRNSIEILTKHVKNDIPDPRQYDVSIPESVARLTMHMMAKDPAHRPQSAREVAETIQDVLSKESARFQRAAAPKRVAGAAQVVPRPQLRRAVRQRRQTSGALSWLLILGVLAVVALTVLSIMFGIPGTGEGGGNGANGGKPRGGLTQEELGRLFERADMHRQRGNYDQAERILRDIAGKMQGREASKKADRLIAELADLRAARRVYRRLLQSMRKYPKAFKTWERHLEKFLKDYGSAPEAVDARRRLAAVQEALRTTGSDGPTPKGPTRGDEARKALNTTTATADALVDRQEFFAAERALLDFAAMFTGTKAAETAKKRAKELHGLGDAYLGQLMTQARKHTFAKEYRRATELYSQIISADPNGDWGAKARKALADQEAGTKVAFQKGWNAAMAEMEKFNFVRCSNLATEAAKGLSSTRWQARLDRLAADSLLCGQLHAAMIKVIANHGSEVRSPFMVTTPFGKRRGRIVGATDEGVSVKADPATVPVKWKDMKASELATVYQAYNVPREHKLAAGMLFAYRDLKAKALQELRGAREHKPSREEAERRIAELEGRANLLSYDFSSGLQMLDWNPESGTWEIKKNVLSGGGQGESLFVLQKRSYSARGLVLSFEVRLAGAKNVTVDLFASADDYLGVTIDPAQGIALSTRIAGNSLTTMDKTKLDPGSRHTVRLTVKGKQLRATVDGKALSPLEVPQVDTLTGKLRFKVLDGQVTIDNVQIRNQAR
jgi:pSer/pThr/pTyr-binding forkhead associated (FHA) protein/tetratricopeptide (TPR) repeat protein